MQPAVSIVIDLRKEGAIPCGRNTMKKTWFPFTDDTK